MFVLDKKSYDLLIYLMGLENPETIMEISKTLNQSRRKIYYHLDKINDVLPADVDKIISYPRVGIVLSSAQKSACQELLAQLDDYSYVMSVEERIQLTLTYIAISKERVTLEKLMKLNDVSRNTVLNDLNDIRSKLSEEEYDIQLQVTKVSGYYFVCHPLSKIQFLYRLLYRIYTEGNKNFVDIIRDRLIDLTGLKQYFSDEVNNYIHQSLTCAQETLGKTLNPQDSLFMVQILPYLLLSYRSIELTEEERQAVNRDFSLTWKRKEYALASKIAQGLEQRFELQLDKIEISLVAMLLLSFRKDRDSHLESQDYAEMKTVLNRFLMALSEQYHLNFKHYDDLLNQLLRHCKALLYRKTYGIVSVNPLTQQIKTRYSDLFQMTQGCASLLEESWLIRLNDDDIAYLVIHLGGELVKDVSQLQENKSVIIVCDEGIGIQKLLLSQCESILNHCLIQAVFTSEQFYSVADIVVADIVISTSDALETSLPVMVVQPILTELDRMKLSRIFNHRENEEFVSISQKLENCLQPYVPDVDERRVLKAQISHILEQEMMQSNKL
ncbi:BglG family transcription antiterminator [Streptococcus caprae]|uniref:BglG family transcription antiterminator n=1 Tax=Streptococcus caprae TaxID=1640501 RepID=A0ABV8CWS3_9STRE